jgi:periplasmic divalent cation tolerance protein
MRIFYITLSNETQARDVAVKLLERRDAACCNWFPVQSAYVWEGEIRQEPEMVLIVKSVAEKRDAVAAAVREVIDYTNFIGEIELDEVNDGFGAWLQGLVG